MPKVSFDCVTNLAVENPRLFQSGDFKQVRIKLSIQHDLSGYFLNLLLLQRNGWTLYWCDQSRCALLTSLFTEEGSAVKHAHFSIDQQPSLLNIALVRVKRRFGVIL